MKNFILVLFCFFYFSLNGFNQKQNAGALSRPKLVVGIVVDQMRWDYLYRYHDRYTLGGFKRLLNEGFTCENTLIPYLPTYTAPGHTSIYTGSVPAIHGIIGNFWYSKTMRKSTYCTDDTVSTVGSTSDAGKMSPRNMWVTTVTDELRLATNFRSKVIGIALKDRGAILPAGHAANAAYWFDNVNGAFITSTYYMKSLPDWVNRFNNRKLPDQYLKQNWNTLYPIETYVQSTPDDKFYEGIVPHEDNTFPHNTENITKDKYNTLRYTPYGNTLTIDMAKAAIEAEHLGSSATTDFLTVSFSSTDYIGHAFGPNSIEAEDTYLRLDMDLSAFLTYLDKQVGKGNYTVFLTADHGVAHVPEFLLENNIHAENVRDSIIKTSLNEMAENRFKIKDAVAYIINDQIFLSKNVEAEQTQIIINAIVKRLLEFPFIANAVNLSNVSNTTLPEVQKNMLANGYNQKLSGEIQFFYKPHDIEGSNRGTTHGSWNPYDAHIPLLWYGWGIKKGKTNRETYMTDIAATLSALLHIQMPSGCIGKVIEEVIKN